MSIVMFLNLKGGVAKTTSAVAVAEYLASKGHRTLVIDADHQCTASEMLVGEERQLSHERKRKTLHDLLTAMLRPDFAPSQIDRFVARDVSNIAGGLPKLSLLPCSIRIDALSTNWAKGRRGHGSNDDFLRVLDSRRNELRGWLQKNYHYTIIDCPPSLALQVRFLLCVADSFVLPSVPDRLSTRGSLYLMDRLRRNRYKIRPLGLLWSLYRSQNALHRRVIESAASGDVRFSKLPRPFRTVIPNATAIAEAPESERTPTTFKRKYAGEAGKLFADLCQELVQRIEWQKSPQKVAPGSAVAA